MNIKRFLPIILLFLPLSLMADEREDSLIQQRCLQSLADFTSYAKSIYTDAGKNSRGDAVGYFKAVSAGQSNEDGCAMLTVHIRLSG